MIEIKTKEESVQKYKELVTQCNDRLRDYDELVKEKKSLLKKMTMHEMLRKLEEISSNCMKNG